MKLVSLLGAVALILSGCAAVTDIADRIDLVGTSLDAAVPSAPADPFVADAAPVQSATLAPQTAAPPPPPAAVTADALDTTTQAQRAAASAPPEAEGRALGTTIVSLGSPSEPGLWLKTPLVEMEAQGRVTNPANGKSSLVTLLPLDGPETGGSRMSLAAMRLIEAGLTDLTEVQVALEG
ncbi:MAG: hypothetical protein AAF307_01630 [Pseudomonadota bacterium]